MNDLESVRIGDYYEPQVKQQEFHNSNARYPLAEGGRGFRLMGTRTGGNVFSVAGQGNANKSGAAH
jgi:hypothetical protein